MNEGGDRMESKGAYVHKKAPRFFLGAKGSLNDFSGSGEGRSKPFLEIRAEDGNRFHLTVQSAEESDDPEDEQADKNQEHQQPAQDRDEHEDHVDGPATDAEDHQTERLTQVEGDESGTAVTAHDERDHEADDGEIANDRDRLVV